MELIESFVPLIGILVISAAFGFYLGRKAKRHKESLVSDESAPINCLTLARGVEPTNYLRKYIIFIDNVVVGKISSGETKHFDLKPGKHNVSVKIDWCKSKPFEFEIIENTNTKLMCGANYNKWKCMFMYAIKPSNWIYVKVA